MLLSNPIVDYVSLLKPLKKPKIWFYLAWIDVLNQYRRSLLGPFWILLSLIIFSTALSSVYSGLFDIAFKQYITYVTTGMIAWQWASAILVNTGTIYTANTGLLKDYPTDKAYFIWSHVTSQIIVFFHQLPLVVVFYLLGLLHLSWNILYLIPSLILVFAINLGVGAIFAVAVNRYRDLNRILGSLTMIIMMTTPIFWMPSSLASSHTLIYEMNPFYYIIEVIRDPLMGKPANPHIYLVTTLMAMALLAIGSIVHKRHSQAVVFRL
jgi:ABC-type polysaccharide/polyol phosphate export permease